MRWVFGVGSVLVTAAGVQLFVLTDHTTRYFAWTISSGLSAAFLGAFYFTALVLASGSARQAEWARARVGVFGVWLFVTLTLVATLLHLDKFLQRERVLPIAVPVQVDDRALHTSEKLSASETFGELDVRALLRAFALPGSVDLAAGWGGGRLALYVGADGATTTALVVRWDSAEDAGAWRAVAPLLATIAFPGADERMCPAVDHCWISGTREIAATAQGDVTVFASGAAGELVAAALARSNG